MVKISQKIQISVRKDKQRNRVNSRRPSQALDRIEAYYLDMFLAAEILCEIFSYLDFESKKSATLTCRKFHHIIRHDPELSGHLVLELYLEVENINIVLSGLWPEVKTVRLLQDRFVGYISDCDECDEDGCPWSQMKLLHFEQLPKLEKVFLEGNFNCHFDSYKEFRVSDASVNEMG